MAQQPNLLQGPEPVETAELHFKLLCKLKVFETNTKYEEGHCCILAVSQYYGLIFVGNLNGFTVIPTKSLHAGTSLEEFPRNNIVLNLRPTHISVDISQKFLVVVCHSKPGSALLFYNILSLSEKVAKPFKVTALSRLMQKFTAEVVDLIWQPNAAGSFVICMSDGSVLALPQGFKDETMYTLPSSTQATCFCWSPKGKQIVIGSATGTLSQYKPDLKLVKTLPPPPLYDGNVMVVSVLWISSFQFAVAYNDRANPESFPVITIVNAAKNEPVNVINYDDIPYSSTLFRNHQIYMSHQTAWNLIFISSANSIEIAVLHLKDGSSWEQWLLGDASRAELPLNPDRQETFPLGWGFDYTSQETIPWGEGSLPPMPRLLLVSDEGLLCVFNVVNTAGDAPQLCAPPTESIDESQFTVSEQAEPAVTSDAASPERSQKSILGSPPAFGSAKPAYNVPGFSAGFGGFGTRSPAKAPQDASVTPQQQQSEQPLFQIQQPQQLPVQTQAQLQPQAQQVPLVLPAQPEPSAVPFKLSFGTAPSFSLGGGSTVAFTAKPAAAERSQPSEPAGGSFALQSSPSQKDLFSAKTLPQSTPIKQPEVRVQEKQVTSPTKKTKEVEAAGKATEEAAAKGDSAGPGTPELAAVDDSVYLSALAEEIEHFNSELQQLSARVGTLDIQLGGEEDKAKMKKSIDGLYSFWKELKETTEGQSVEIHAVVMDLMEAFAWLEDAKSRNLQRKNPSYIELKKSEELDPLNARHMNEISHLKYYIVNQLKQLTEHLEKEWMDHQQNHRNEIKSKMTVPPLEEVYKTMHYQLKILHRQKALVEELKGRMALKKRKNKSHAFPVTSANTIISSNTNGNRASELSKLAENLLQLKINKEEEAPQTAAWELIKAQLTAISERSKKLTREKQTALRDVLSERDMVKIRPVRTTLESSTFLRSLHLEKATSKPPKSRPHVKHNDSNRKETPLLTANAHAPVTEPEPKSEAPPEDKPAPVTKADAFKNAASEKAAIPLTVQSLSKPEEKSPLASLSGIVSSIGKQTDSPAFVFRGPNFQKAEPSKEVGAGFGGKSEQKEEEPKVSQPFTFGVSKPSESIFGKKDPIVFGAKPTFNLPSSISVVMTKSDATKGTTVPNITITPIATTAAATSLPFSFAAATTAPASKSSSLTFTAVTTAAAGLPSVNLLFTGKEATSGFGTATATKNIFSITPITSAATSTTTSTSTSLFGSSVSIFGSANKTPTTTSTAVTTTTTTFSTSTSLFGFAKPATEAPAQSSESKSEVPTNGAAHTPSKGTSSESEEVDVVEVDEPVKKPEPPSEKSKDSPKSTTTPVVAIATTPSAVSVPSTAAKSPLEVTSTAPSSVSAVSTPQSAVSTTNIFSKLVSAPATSSTETPTAVATASTSSPSTAATTTSVFSFSTMTTPLFFGQTATPTTATGFFGTPTTTTSLFGQVSTTPTTNIFGGSVPTSPASSIFGGSTPVKAASGQPSTPSTTSENIFGASTTPTTNSFGQVSTPLSEPRPFGQKSESIDQTANLFGQMLSDNNKSIFGGSSTPATTASLFSSSKGIFASTTTAAPVFGSSVFGQPRTTTNVFGQSQTSGFFSQNVFSGFGKGSTTTPSQTPLRSGGFSQPVFGQSVFGQRPSTFGSSSTNFFQTPTTNTTFGSTSPGSVSSGTAVFGSSSATFQKPLGVFGSPGSTVPTPAFGGSPTFGGSPSFGSLPTFGGMSQGGFGQSTGSTTFENLANQNTVGFGNLAQQTQNQGFGVGFGSPSFESKPAFGGDSFSSWRSK